jgi:molybdopterin/thiamine biosynthesis adenylyltransferase
MGVITQLLEWHDVEFPEEIDSDTVYRLLPRQSTTAFYRERTDRNIGWITEAEQEILYSSVVGIAGTGGMGGLLASILVRLGVGEVRISDSDVFDVSNINRQFAATRTSIGKSKVIETARMVRAISDDSTIVVYPQGITEQTVDHFVRGCDIICDEIEVLAVDARILLHQQARAADVSLFNCNTVGFSTNLFLYTPDSMTIEKATGLNYEDAKRLRIEADASNRDAIETIVQAMMHAVVPKLPEYRSSSSITDQDAFYERFVGEQKVPIIATNPPMAAGFLANRVLLYLLRNSGVPRTIFETPKMPGYLHFDAAHLQILTGKED